MDELTSWKDIANYLGVSVRTAQLWESQRGLPVRRLPGPRGRVLAATAEIDAWKLSGEGPAETRAPQPSNRRWLWAVGGVAVLTAGLMIGRQGIRPVDIPLLETKPLTTERGLEQRPSLAPGGTEAAFLEKSEGESSNRITILTLASGGRRGLVSGLSNENRLAWSPDGKTIAYTQDNSGTVELWSIPAAGGDGRLVARLNGEDRVYNAMESQMPGWTPDSRKICIPDRDREGEPLGLFLINAETGRRERLTAPPAESAGDVQCAPSPDGRLVAFVRQFTVSEGDLHILDRRDGQLRRVTQVHGHFLGLAWMPGEVGVLAGLGVGAANSSIWQIRLDGTPPRRITGKETPASFPAVAAIGSSARVVYQTTQRDSNIWRWSAVTGAARFTESGAPDQYPGVNRKGEVAWISRRTGSPELFVSGGEGLRETNARQLSALRESYADFPRWSPDGRLIAYSAAVHGDRDVLLHNLAEASAHLAPGVGTEEGRASFSQDGKWLYFRSDRSGEREIWRVPLSGPEPVQVTRGGGYEGFEDPSGNWLYYVKTREKPGLWRVAVAGGRAEMVDSGVWEGRWALAADGIYSLRKDGGHVWRTGWRGENGTLVTTLPKSAGVEAGLAVSPDGKWIYWTQIDRVSADLHSALVR